MQERLIPAPWQIDPDTYRCSRCSTYLGPRYNDYVGFCQPCFDFQYRKLQAEFPGTLMGIIAEGAVRL